METCGMRDEEPERTTATSGGGPKNPENPEEPEMCIGDVHNSYDMVFSSAVRVAQTLCGGAMAKDASEFPHLHTTPLTIDLLRLGGSLMALSERQEGSEPTVVAQTMVHGCDSVLVLSRDSHGHPEAMVVAVDDRLHSQQRRVDLIKMPSFANAHDNAWFDGTVLFGVRVDERTMFLHDIAVSSGYLLAGAPKAANFVARLVVCERVCAVLNTLLGSVRWSFQVAPWIPCGTHHRLEAIKDKPPRGMWIVANHRQVQEPRWRWTRNNHVHMLLAGNTWFLAGEDAALHKLAPDVRVVLGEDGDIQVATLCPTSIGVFVPRVEHHASGECYKYLVLCFVHQAHEFRTMPPNPWTSVQYNLSSLRDVEVAFESLSSGVPAAKALLPFVTQGRPAPAAPLSAAPHTCVFHVHHPNGATASAAGGGSSSTKRSATRRSKSRKRKRRQISRESSESQT